MSPRVFVGVSMTRTLIAAMLAMMTLLTPLALAQGETNETRDAPADEGEQAWVDDCPPDMMCAYDTPQEYGDEDCIECSGPVDDGAEPGQSLGPEDCIDCMQAPRDDAGTCMDGQDANETCDDDVQYLDGGEPTRGPTDGSCEYCRGGENDDENVVQPPEGAEGGITSVQDESAEQKSPVPAPAVALGILAVAGAALILVARRK